MTYSLPRREAEAEPVVVELEPVPTVDDLVRMGYAEPAPKGVRVLPRGHALMGEIMRRNGAKMREIEEQRPPVQPQPKMTPAQAAYLWARDAFDTPD